MTRRVVCVVAVCVGLACISSARQAEAQRCFPTFGYGNVGYSSGYSIQQVGWCGPRWGGWCGPRWGWGGGWCAPRWGWGCRPWGWRNACYAPAYSCGWPAWYGTTWFPSCDSTWYASPVGGSFFSGSMIPFPTIGSSLVAPGFMPGFVSSNASSTPVAALAGSRPAVPQVVATIRDLRARRDLAQQAHAPVAPTVVRARPSNALARLRAARLVAAGDRQLREANGDPVLMRRAVDSYRRAAAIAGDQPDTYVREALALVALDDRGQADAALAKAVAIDGRLADTPPAPGNQPPDPVFGDRPAGAAQPLAARGVAVLRQIGAEAGATIGDDAPALAWLAGRWANRFGDGMTAVAASGRAVR